MKINLSDPTLGLPVADMTKHLAPFSLQKTEASHINELGMQGLEIGTLGQPSDSFASILSRGLDATSSQQLEAAGLAQMAVSDPESVNAHEVTVAMAKANMSLSITKSIIDRSINSFKDILSQR
jgi:flagellar hook-basal body complex protein FliE